MAQTVEVFDTAGGVWEPIDYNSARIDRALGGIRPAPEATVRAPRQPITAGQDLRIREDGTTIFKGVVDDPKVSGAGELKLKVTNDAADTFDADVTFTETAPTDADVLATALSNASGPGLSLNYVPTPVSLGDDYEADGRTVRRVFQDMMDAAGRVFWVDGDTVTVNDLGAGGSWATIDTGAGASGATVREYSAGAKETVRNRVRVNGTGGERVVGTAADSASISEYGEHAETVNYAWIRSQSVADSVASELLIPDPLAEAELQVTTRTGDIVSPAVNQTVTVTDPATDIDGEEFVIESQTTRQGEAVLNVGEGAGVDIESKNRQEKSTDENAEPGSVYNTDRIADDAVNEGKLVDLSVTERKLDDLAVTQQKLQNNAVVNGKLADLSVSETKVQDDSISTPKLVAEAVTAAEIEADTITAAQIASGTVTAEEIEAFTITANEIASRTISAILIEADTLTANEIAASTITADEIDSLQLTTNQIEIIGDDTSTSLIFEDDATGSDYFIYPSGTADLRIGKLADPVDDIVVYGVRPPFDNIGQIGTPDRAYTGVTAYNFNDAATGTTINDGGDPLAGLADGHGPPDYAAQTDESGEIKSYSINKMARGVWDVVRSQQSRIETLEDRIATLEDAVDPNA